MIGFFIKKAFFDGWDHLFSIVFLNVGFIAVLALGALLPGALGGPAWLGLGFVVVAALLGSVWWATCVYALKPVSDFGSFHACDLGPALKEAFVPGLQMGGILVLGILFLSIGLPFYFQIDNLLGPFAAGLLFWCAVILALALQYYVPLRARLGGGLRKNLRKSFLVFFDNPLFSLFLFVYNALGLALSFLLAFLAPGFGGVALAMDVAIRLRLYKYDWLEANPEANRRQIPWPELLAEDEELVGKRTLKGMIFPWKE
jgi:hypothetical protein